MNKTHWQPWFLHETQWKCFFKHLITGDETWAVHSRFNQKKLMQQAIWIRLNNIHSSYLSTHDCVISLVGLHSPYVLWNFTSQANDYLRCAYSRSNQTKQCISWKLTSIKRCIASEYNAKSNTSLLTRERLFETC